MMKAVLAVLLLAPLAFPAVAAPAVTPDQDIVDESIRRVVARDASAALATPDQDIVDESIRLVQALVRIPSISDSEHEAGAFLDAYGREKGFHVYRFDSPDGKPNVLLSTGTLPPDRPHLVFLTHLDVVPVEGQDWTHPPFSGAIVNGELWGRGAIDNKGAMGLSIGAIFAYLRKHGASAPVQVSVLAVHGEENDGGGAEHVATNHLSLIAPTVMVGEGGVGIKGLVDSAPDVPVIGIATSEKSSLWLRLQLKLGGSGHGSVPRDETAVTAMVKALNQLKESPFSVRLTDDIKQMLAGLARLESWPRNLFLRNPTWPIIARVIRKFLQRNPVTASMIMDTANITGVGSDPTPPNVVPKGSWATLDCRLLPGTDEDQFLQELQERLDDPRITIQVLNRKPNVLGSGGNPGLEQLRLALEETFEGSVAVPIVFPATSDSNIFRQTGVPVFGVLPVVMPIDIIESIHGPDERLPLAGVPPGIQAYLRYIERFAGE